MGEIEQLMGKESQINFLKVHKKLKLAKANLKVTLPSDNGQSKK